MKLYLKDEEWYPVYELSGVGHEAYAVEVSEEFHARYEAAFKEFKAVQDLLEEADRAGAAAEKKID